MFRSLTERFHLNVSKFIKLKSVYIVFNDDKKFVIKKRNDNSVMNYLKMRNFDYFPKVLDEDETYQLMEFIDEIDVPCEQKIFDLIDIVSLLHYKTTYFKEIDLDYYKGLYEDVLNNIEYLYSYYNDLISVIDEKEFMAPYEYVIARNIGKIYQVLDFSREQIELWYDSVKDNKKVRVVVIHNNLDFSHFLRNESSYLISWEKAKIDSPIFDLYKLYKRCGNDIDFGSVLNRYEEKYPLLDYEKRFLFILMLLPDEVNISGNVYMDTMNISERIDLIYKTESIILPYYSKEGKD